MEALADAKLFFYDSIYTLGSSMRLLRLYALREYTLDGVVQRAKVYVRLKYTSDKSIQFCYFYLFECPVASGLRVSKFEFRSLSKQTRVSNELVL